MSSTLEQRFWCNVHPEPNTGCWLWGGVTATTGYGVLSVGARKLGQISAAHVSLDLHGRPRPEGLHACHHCDVRACVNPDHLYWGTPKDNVADMIRRGRDTRPNNEDHGGHKLTKAQVRAIRESSDTQPALAAAYGVSQSLVSRIKAGNRRRHV